MLASRAVEVTPLSIRIPVSVRSLFVIALALVSFAVSSVAHAAGRVEWKGKSFKEREDKAWRLEVAIYMPKAPDVPHVPMKFEFQPQVYYERDMVDGDKIVEHKVPLENHQALIESVDVGFLDSGSGKIEPRTRFSFKLTRAHGYEAGEYKVSIHDGRNDQAVGTPVTLIFEGENEIIDRRAMVFSGGDKKKKDTAKKDDAKSDDKPADADKKAEEDKPAASDDKPTDAAEGDKKDAPSDEPQTIKEKPGGCGCRLADNGTGSLSGLGFAALALGSIVLRRRRKLAA
ncbi:MAG: MYXO-CTERM sorting domain-containing protein [Polyangiaceae bacterium]